jgi:N-acetylmuramoyl-L-alanine amidase
MTCARPKRSGEEPRTVPAFSDILIGVRHRFSHANLIVIALVAALLAAAWAQQAPQPPQNPPAPPAATPQTPVPAQQPTPPPRPALSVVVLDPAHGGPDAGAHGATGIVESEVVLSFARQVRVELERQGLRVVMTRQGNENPSFDDRSATANAQRGAIFMSLHVSSNGPPGTARVYSVAAAATAPAARPALLPWDQAQEPYAAGSRRLGELVAVQLAQKFRGSPEVPSVAPVRQLRTVAAPAIAIEISSVAVPERSQLEQMGPPLAEAVARAVDAFRPLYEAGAK